MTRVVFVKDARGRLIGFNADGHSGYAESGKDIVCAAISALTQTAIIGLEDVAGVKLTKREDEQAGFLSAEISADTPEDKLRDSQILLNTLKLALTAISGEYPGTIRIIIRERR